MNTGYITNDTGIVSYIKAIYQTIFFPSKTFKELNIGICDLIGYLILSAWLYAILANILRTLSPFLLLILSPLSVVPHVLLISLSLYLIFVKFYKAKSSFGECFKISSYIIIALLPFMGIVFVKTADIPALLALKALPFIYFIALSYKASLILFKNLKTHKLIQGNVLACLVILFISTIVFTINMVILGFLSEAIFHYSYVWKMSYN